MRNLKPGNEYQPAARTAQVSSIHDVFREDTSPSVASEWVKTSVNLRPDMRRRLKRYAAEHDVRIQDVIDTALNEYLR